MDARQKENKSTARLRLTLFQYYAVVSRFLETTLGIGIVGLDNTRVQNIEKLFKVTTDESLSNNGLKASVGPRWPIVLGVEGFEVPNPIPLKIRHVLSLLHVKSYVGVQTSSHWSCAEVWRGESHVSFSLSDRGSKLRGPSQKAFVLLQNGTLI
ncbi:hypothetical protein AVEN_136338-1 [Araneus ventricosus]|uniref:Uncharacterized protein n=1 Tax=Araneus ventricosus TaxID=182803 RepID=A0A4Y2E198_ARAVE|nr:hypothetical protein AVEN_136338-1 [Araneus ventricosus]